MMKKNQSQILSNSIISYSDIILRHNSSLQPSILQPLFRTKECWKLLLKWCFPSPTLPYLFVSPSFPFTVPFTNIPDLCSSLRIRQTVLQNRHHSDDSMIFVLCQSKELCKINTLLKQKTELQTTVSLSSLFICSTDAQLYCSKRMSKFYGKIYINTLRTGLLNCLNARSQGLTFRHRASCI